MKYKTIFLDIDGVLNSIHSLSREPTGCVGIDTKKINNLAKIVAAEPDVRIVLTSDWREHYALGAYKQEDRVGRYLNNKIRKAGLRIYDVLPPGPSYKRGQAILDWLGDHPGADPHFFIILDDNPFDFFSCGLQDHLVKCLWDIANPALEGLTDSLVDRAIEMLRGDRVGPVYDKEFEKIWKEA